MSRTKIALLALVFSACAAPVHASWMAPFISELHYDNTGRDVDEFVAVTGPSGFDLSGWELLLYNGGDGRAYDAMALSGMLGDPGTGLAEAVWQFSGIQNGPDAVALLSPLDAVVDFIAYEAGVSASAGAAQGLTAQPLTVAEDGSTPTGWSLQRIGPLDAPLWIAAPATPGALNPGLGAVDTGNVPTMGVGALWFAGAGGWLLTAFGRRTHLRMA